MADCGIKKLWRAWDLVILTGLIKNSSKIDGGMEKNLLKITGYGHSRTIATLTRRDRVKQSDWRGTAPKIVAGCGIETLYVGPSLLS